MPKKTHPLRAYREAHGITDAAMAKRVKISRVSIWRIESGQQSPKLRTVQRFIDATAGALTANDFLPITKRHRAQS